MAIFRLRLFRLPLGYCPSFSAIGLCFVNMTHSHDNGHSLTSTIAILRLNYKVPRPLGGWYVYFNVHGYCQNVLGYSCLHVSLPYQSIHNLLLATTTDSMPFKTTRPGIGRLRLHHHHIAHTQDYCSLK